MRSDVPTPSNLIHIVTLDPLLLVVDLLACYRLTRLITKDTLLQEIRWWILQRWPNEGTEFPDAIVTKGEKADGTLPNGLPVFRSTKEDEDGDPIWLPYKTHKITELVECPYCASVWLAFGVLALRVWWDWWQYPALGLALAGGVALIFAKLDSE